MGSGHIHSVMCCVCLLLRYDHRIEEPWGLILIVSLVTMRDIQDPGKAHLWVCLGRCFQRWPDHTCSDLMKRWTHSWSLNMKHLLWSGDLELGVQLKWAGRLETCLYRTFLPWSITYSPCLRFLPTVMFWIGLFCHAPPCHIGPKPLKLWAKISSPHLKVFSLN